MNNYQRINLNLLGHKRRNKNLMKNDESKTDEKEKTKENNSKKKADFFYILRMEKNKNNLEDKNKAGIGNINTKINNKICQKCNSKDNLLFFNSNKSILGCLSKRNIFIFKGVALDKNFNFDSPKIICSNCLLMISKHQNEFEEFIETNKYKINEDNDNPFNNLYDNSNLNNFNNVIKENKSLKSYEFNGNCKEICEKLSDDKIVSSINSGPNTNNTNSIWKKNFNSLNTLNYPYLPSINYNTPFNQKLENLNLPNHSNNNLNSLFDINTYLENPEMKKNNTNQNNSLHTPKLNNPNILQNTFLNKHLGPFPSFNERTLNLCPLTNENYSINNNENKEKKIPNNFNANNDKEEISKDNNEILEQNNISNNFTIIENKDFDEFFQIISNLFHRLLDIKYSHDLISNTQNN